MKLLISITFLAIVIGIQALTDEQKQKLKQISEECKPISGVTQEMIDEARHNPKLFEESKFKIHSRCVLEKEGFLTESGDLVIDTIKTKLKEATGNDDDEIDRIAKKCAVKKDTPEETAHQLIVCLRKEKPSSRP